MSGILQQLGLDTSFFVQFGIIAAVFILLSNVYFKPFLKLFQARHKKMVEDREAAENLVKQADAKFEEYRKRLSEERAAARRDIEALILEAKKEETQILGNARNEAKKITQDAAESAGKQRELLQKQLEQDVESLARTISDSLLSGQEK